MTMLSVRNFLMYLASAVIMLHCLLPHQHADELTAKEHAAMHADVQGLFDQLQFLLHEFDSLEDVFLHSDDLSEAVTKEITLAVKAVFVLFPTLRFASEPKNQPPPEPAVFPLANLVEKGIWGIRPPPVV